MVDLRTTTEIARDEKHKRICSQYLSLSNKMPNVSKNRLLTFISKTENMTSVGVKNILIEKGLYIVKSTKK